MDDCKIITPPMLNKTKKKITRDNPRRLTPGCIFFQTPPFSSLLSSKRGARHSFFEKKPDIDTILNIMKIMPITKVKITMMTSIS